MSTSQASPTTTTTTLVSATTTLGSYVFDLLGTDRASIQLNATLASSDTDVVTLLISNDGVNFVGFSTAKTVTFTGGSTVNALFELGAIDYRFLKVSWAAPSASTLTLVAVLNSVPTYVSII